MVSEKRREASRRNAQKSTGPRTVEGKARSSQNAVTHGLTAKPEEDRSNAGREAFQKRLAEWVEDQRPVGAAQRAVVEAACRAAWRLERCGRHDDAAVGERLRHAEEKQDADARAEAEAIGRPLIDGPYAGPDPYGEPTAVKDLAGTDPASRVDRLKRTAQGVDWLLERWGELGRILDHEGYWQARERDAATRLLGRRPEEYLNESDARAIFTYSLATYLTSAPSPRPLAADCLASCPDPVRLKAEIGRVLAIEARPIDAAGALESLKMLVRSERGKLLRLKETVLDARAAADRAAAPERALVDDGPSGELLHRYETSASRALHRVLADLRKLREDDGREGDGPDMFRDEDGHESDGREPSAGEDRAPLAPGDDRPVPPMSSAGGEDAGGQAASEIAEDAASASGRAVEEVTVEETTGPERVLRNEAEEARPAEADGDRSPRDHEAGSPRSSETIGTPGTSVEPACIDPKRRPKSPLEKGNRRRKGERGGTTRRR